MAHRNDHDGHDDHVVNSMDFFVIVAFVAWPVGAVSAQAVASLGRRRSRQKGPAAVTVALAAGGGQGQGQSPEC